MTYLLDTNIISEVMKPSPNPNVIAWFLANQDDCGLSAITLAEMADGVESLDEGKRKRDVIRRLSFFKKTTTTASSQ